MYKNLTDLPIVNLRPLPQAVGDWTVSAQSQYFSETKKVVLAREGGQITGHTCPIPKLVFILWSMCLCP